jgi:hypothetical protein
LRQQTGESTSIKPRPHAGQAQSPKDGCTHEHHRSSTHKPLQSDRPTRKKSEKKRGETYQREGTAATEKTGGHGGATQTCTHCRSSSDEEEEQITHSENPAADKKKREGGEKEEKDGTQVKAI